MKKNNLTWDKVLSKVKDLQLVIVNCIGFIKIIILKFCNERIYFDWQGGCAVRLFHKELEAYLVAEGLFDEGFVEDGRYIIALIFCIQLRCWT